MKEAAKYIDQLQNNLICRIRTHGYPEKLKSSSAVGGNGNGSGNGNGNGGGGNRSHQFSNSQNQDSESIKRTVQSYLVKNSKWS
jgi:hypothetical protein